MVYALISILLTLALAAHVLLRGPWAGAPTAHLSVVGVLTVCATFTAACYAWKAADGEPEEYLEPTRPILRVLLAGLLWPYSFVAALVLVVEHHFSHEAFADEVSPALWVGRLPMPWERAKVAGLGVQAVLNLCLEFGDLPGLQSASLDYARIPMLDSAPPSLARLERAVAWCVARLDAGQPVLAHCAHGHGRSALVAAATVLARNPEANPDDVVRDFRSIRPGIRLSRRQRAVLDSFYAKRN